MPVFSRIPKLSILIYKWKRYDTALKSTWYRYSVIYQWKVTEYQKYFEYNVYSARDGEPLYEEGIIRTEWLDSPFQSGLPWGGSQLEYYEYTGESKEEFLSNYLVGSNNREEYPDDSSSEGEDYHVYYYKYSGAKKGADDTKVVVPTINQPGIYPDGEEFDGYWYEFIGEEYINSQEGETIIVSDEEDAYPDDGRHSDGYWYVRYNQLLEMEETT